jgi:hypothetical protein
VNEMQQGKIVCPLHFEIKPLKGHNQKHHFQGRMASRNLDGLKLVPL